MAHSNDGRRNFHVISIMGNVVDKSFVDFEHVQWEVFKVCQRGISRAKIVDGQMSSSDKIGSKFLVSRNMSIIPCVTNKSH